MPFPALQPTARNLTYGEYPVKAYKALSGAVTTRLFGDRPSNFQLQLTYTGLSAANVELLLSHYDSVRGGYKGFTLPDALWAGEDATLRSRYQNLDGVLWYYASPPQLGALKGATNRDVTVQLAGNLYG